METRTVTRRAFDKAVRRKPLALAADAGLWRLNGVRKGGASDVGMVSLNAEERVANWATLKSSSRVVLGMSSWVKQGLVWGQGVRRGSAPKHAKFSGWEERLHAATVTQMGGERSWIWAAVSLSTITIGAPQ